MRAQLPISMTARNIGFSELMACLHRDFENAEIPLPVWARVRDKAKETHRAIDMQLMLATGDDLEAMRERKSKCSSSKQP